MNKILLVSAIAGLTFASVAANALEATTNFQVTLTVRKACSVSATNLAFAPTDPGATATPVSANIVVTCSKNTPYSVGLLPGNSNANGAGTMAGTGANTETIDYVLRSGSSTGTAWGNTIGTNVVSGMSPTGVAVTHPVFGTATVGNVLPDSYSDTVKVTVTY
ncbi:MAG TPA: spore coat protein U domain-containing protein [Variovorax sp.]|nr:spore coat protein U domain-containing protein [Variovorax sp.]